MVAVRRVRSPPSLAGRCRSSRLRSALAAAKARRLAPGDSPGGEWRTYGHDSRTRRSQPREHAIAADDGPLLTPAWGFSTEAGGDGDFTGTPIVADGCMYVGDERRLGVRHQRR